MAIVNDTNDKMRDIIAAEAAKLEGGADPDLDDAEVAEEVPDADAVSAESESVEGAPDGAEGAEADVEAAVDEGAAGDVAVTAAADKAAAESAAGAEGAGKAGAKAEAVAKEDAFAKEHGLKATDKSGRVNRIPYPVIRDRIVPNAIKKAEMTWAKEKLEPFQRTNKDQAERLGAIAETERIQFEEPRRFLTMLAHIPGYTQLFDELSQGKFSANVKAAAPNASDAADDPKPTPDAKDEKGNVVGWTQDGMEKRFAWERRQATREAQAATDAKYKKISQRFEADEAAQAVTESIDGIIGLAAEWPGFKDNYVPIVEALGKGTEKLDTPQKMYRAVQLAYNEVMFGVVGKAKETEEQRRERYFKEFTEQARRAPRSTAARSTVRREEPVVENENVSADDRMRNIIAASARKAGLL